MSDFTSRLKKYTEFFEKTLAKFCEGLDCKPPILAESMRYTLENGGKRIRPVLMYAAADVLCLDRAVCENFALALELIHTYSLIHDDLPEMDNDDMRRGKPANHIVYGAGNAVLAGDALLNTAYSVLLSECMKGSDYISAAEFVCDCAGIYGMIAGQSADLLHEKDSDCNPETLGFIYLNKTAKLIMAALVAPSILSGGKYFSELNVLGKYIGYLFQLTDDILDVEGNSEDLGKSVGKDSSEDKYTAVKLYGLDGAKLRADILADRCVGVLEGINGDTSFLKELVWHIRSRKS